MAQNEKRWFQSSSFGCILAVFLSPILIPALVVAVVYRAALLITIWSVWCTRGVHVLLVYSNSPVWQEYVEREIQPRLPERTVVLNWSERGTWRWHSLPVLVFRHFGGSREFNPLVVVFQPFRRTRAFRFWQGFRDYKHGHEQRLRTIQQELFACVETL